MGEAVAILHGRGKMDSLRKGIWVRHRTADRASLAISAPMVAEHCKIPGQAPAQTLQETSLGEWSKWLGRTQATKSRTSGHWSSGVYHGHGSQCSLCAMYRRSTPNQIHAQNNQLTPGMAQSQLISGIQKNL